MSEKSQAVAIVGGFRTPFVKAAGPFANLSCLELALPLLNTAYKAFPSEPEELIYSTVLLNPRFPNLARELVLRSELPKHIEAHFVSNNCISGLLAASVLADHISTNKKRFGFAGGVESMSRPALTLNPQAEALFLKLARARSGTEKLKQLLKWRPAYLMPEAPSPKEPSTGLTMGQHCEITTQEMEIAREDQDQLALASHRNAAQAREALARDIVAIGGVNSDGLVRQDSSLERLAALKPVFERSTKGSITAGNASALTDGASLIALAEPGYAAQKGMNILAYLRDYEFAAIDPQAGLLMAPVFAVQRLLARQKLNFADIDYFEIHEAFAAQVLATLKVWEGGWKRYPELNPLGTVPPERLNVRGGSLALGHPFAATGARLLLGAARLLVDNSKKRALISVCAASGMGCAVLVER